MLVDSNNQILCRQISYLHMLGHADNNLTITKGTRTPLQTRFKRSACRWVIQELYRFFFFKLIGFFSYMQLPLPHSSLSSRYFQPDFFGSQL